MNNYIVINSKDRTSGTSSNFRINLPSNKIKLNGKNKLKLQSIVMYNTLYVINSNNNKIDFNENSTNKTTTLTNGFYNASTLASHIGTAMTSTSSGYATFTATYSTVTGKMTISSTQNFTLKFLTGTNTATSPYRILGFMDTNGILPVDSSVGTSATGNNVVNLGLPTTIYITVKEWNGANVIDTSGTPCSFAIPLMANSNELITLNNQQINQVIEIPSNINILNNISIVLTSNGNVALDLNNSEWSMILELF